MQECQFLECITLCCARLLSLTLAINASPACSQGSGMCVGDLMRSMQLLIYRADEQLLEVRARDFKTHWMTAVEVLDDDTYLGAENSYNLFTLRKNSDAASDEDRNRLEARLL